MKSNIINMAEKMADAEDRWLESVFQSEPVPDDGFSKNVVARIRRRVWVNRLALPVAALIGAAFAIKPATQLVLALLPLLNLMPADALSSPLQFMPQVQTVILGGMTFFAAILLYRMLEEG